MQGISGVADARMQQSFQNPQLRVDVDRSRMAQFGLTELNVTNSVVTSLAGSSQTAPTYCSIRRTACPIRSWPQTPEYKITNLSALENLPITGFGRRAPDPGRLKQDHARAVRRRGVAL